MLPRAHFGLRVKRFIRRCLERLLGMFREGPSPPPRLRAVAEFWARTNPNATTGDWLAFTIEYAEEQYSNGWMRGYEWRERLEQDTHPEELLALDASYDEEWSPPELAPWDDGKEVHDDGTVGDPVWEEYLRALEAQHDADTGMGPEPRREARSPHRRGK